MTTDNQVIAIAALLGVFAIGALYYIARKIDEDHR